MAFTLDEAAFIGFVVEGILYGIYTVVFALSLTSIFWNQRTTGNSVGTPLNWLLLTATCLLFSCCTTHFSLVFDNMYQGLIKNPQPHISNETNVLMGADLLVSVTDFVAQLVLIYRCWIVWNKRLAVVVIPILLSITSLSCAIAAVIILNSLDPTAPIAPASIVPLGISSFTISLALNMLVTGLILGRIYHISHRSSQQVVKSKSRVAVAMEAIVESGLLFLTAQFVFVVLFAISHPAQDVAVAAAVQIYGIAPTLIIVRVALGSAYEALERSATQGALASRAGGPGTMVSITTERHRSDSMELSPLPFSISGSSENRDSKSGWVEKRFMDAEPYAV